VSVTEITLPDGTVAEIESHEYSVEVDGLGVVTAHANKAEARLIERFKRPVYRAIARAIGEEIQEAENMMWQVLLSRYIDNAEGLSLDYLGNRVGEPRQSQNDPNYRIRIRARILINRSRGSAEDLLAIVRALGSTARVQNTGNASLKVEVLTLPANPEVASQIGGLLGEATSGGVGLHVTTPVTVGISATWGSEYDAEMGSVYGSEYDESAGSGDYGHSQMV